MKKIILIFAAFLLFSTTAFAVAVDRNMPSSASPSSSFTVSFSINPEGALTAFDLADFVPSTWTVADWSVSGYTKSDVAFDSQLISYQGATRNGLHWKFSKPLSSAITLSYTMAAPSSVGTYELIAVWTYPGGFNTKSSSLSVGQTTTQPAETGAVCGNNIREGTEECDGSDLAGQACNTKGFVSGTLKCSACKFDTSSCTGQLPSAYQPGTGIPQIPVAAEIIYVVLVLAVIAIVGYWHYHHKPKRRILQSLELEKDARFQRDIADRIKDSE